jgi:hypothetical protein
LVSGAAADAVALGQGQFGGQAGGDAAGVDLGPQQPGELLVERDRGVAVEIVLPWFRCSLVVLPR